MRSWPSPEVPSLHAYGLGWGPAVRVHDTASGELVEVDPADRARMYVCGITPYDATHMGHAATYLAFDLLVRGWRDRGIDVAYTQNVTDIDDPLLERARETGADWAQLAGTEIETFREDMAALSVIAPDHFVGAVESIPEIAELVGQLRDRGTVYDVDGDLYFSVRSDEWFGGLSGMDPATMRALFGERGGDPDRPGKRDPLDCLVWQAAREGEPAWDSRLGRGRPGWHVECAAMALAYLGSEFDVQGGGADLVFPHHEMSAAEARMASGGQPFVRTYVHVGMVGYDGEKMSKSKGNLVVVSTLRRDGHDPAAVRLAVLAHHYRDDWEWTAAGLESATRRLARWRQAFGADSGAPAKTVVEEVRTALADDLDSPRALTAVDAWAEASLAGDGDTESGAPATVALAADALLGIS